MSLIRNKMWVCHVVKYFLFLGNFLRNVKLVYCKCSCVDIVSISSYLDDKVKKRLASLNELYENARLLYSNRVFNIIHEVNVNI